ncbi:MAG: glycosyltransferase family 2 protein [Paludibacter sp.]|jgi:GT2 family glycosyltransferase
MIKVFVVVVTYKGKLWYDRCFSSLRNSVVPLHVVVIDNASPDNTVEFIQNNYPEFHLIKSDKNLGFGRANNLGMRYALNNGANYVFLLNQDAWIEPNTISDLINIHQLNKTYGILSPMHINAERNAIEKGLMHYIADYKLTDPKLIDDLYWDRLDDVYNTHYVNAAAWLLPRKTLEMIGGFDPIFFHYGEDDNYMNRVLYHGFKIGICPKVRIVHDTERRLDMATQIAKKSFKNILVDFCNINKEFSFYSHFVYLSRKIILKLIKLNFKSAKNLLNELKYTTTMRKQIAFSRQQNKIQQSNWL